MELRFLDLKNCERERILVRLCQETNINAVNSEGNSALHLAVQMEFEEKVKVFIDAGIDVSIKNHNLQTGLDLAFRCHNPVAKGKIIKMLVEAGADLNATNKAGTPELHVAVIFGDVDRVRSLISEGADANVRDLGGSEWTALHYAAANLVSEDPATMFRILLEAKADVNARCAHNETALHVLCENKPEVPVVLSGIVELFSQHGADFYAVSDNDDTPMNLAICFFNIEAVKALILNGGIDVNSQFYYHKKTLLHGACCGDDLVTVKFLLKNGANINSLADDKVSPLQYAIDNVVHVEEFFGSSLKEMELLKYLLKWDPDVNTITTDGCNILTPRGDLSALPAFLWYTLLEHIAKLYSVDRWIHPSLIETINRNFKYDAYFAKCIRELHIMKRVYVYPNDGSVSYFNLLMDDKEKLVRYAENVEIIAEGFTVQEVALNFPIYGGFVYRRFIKAIKNRKVLNEAATRLRHLLPPSADLQDRIIKKILYFCSMKDWKNLIDDVNV